MSYQTFNQILADEHVDNEERILFTKRWLKSSYGFGQADEQWVSLLSDVHDHDNLEKHFGEVVLATAFNSLTTRIVLVNGVWHLAVLKKSDSSWAPIHPKIESSYNEASNQKLRLNLFNLLKKGKVVAGQQTGQPSPVENIYASKDKAFEVAEDISSVPVSHVDAAKTKSVSIDLSQYL